MTPISTFPSPLARLILCGGGGLPGAYGRLRWDDEHLSPMFTWSGDSMAVEPSEWGAAEDGDVVHRSVGPMSHPDRWSLPLDAASPWPERLAKVAVWMVGGRTEFAHIHTTPSGLIVLSAWSGPWKKPERWTWTIRGDAAAAPFPLPTLPTYLHEHALAAVLPLALYDVPEIRARVEVA